MSGGWGELRARDPSRAKRRMKLRGRLTIAAGVALLAGSLALALSSGSPDPDVPAVASGPTQPPAAPMRPAALHGTGSRILAPPALLARLPVTWEQAKAAWPPEDAPRFGARLRETVASTPAPSGAVGPLEVEYTLDSELTKAVRKILKQGRVSLGHAVVMDPASGKLLAYLSTDTERFPPTETYPAASLVKIVTAAATLDSAPEWEDRTCHYVGNPYRLTASRVDPPTGGRTMSFRRALAKSNNQCFAQMAVHSVGRPALIQAIGLFGLLDSPGPGHAAGRIEDPGDDAFALGKLGSGLSGIRITPLHAASLAASLADGRRVAPRWIERVSDARGRELELPEPPETWRVLTPELTSNLRDMLVETTVRGTARKAFRTRRGPLLQKIQVAGKTGSLTSRNPDGRYEWFVGIAPADRPRVAVAVLVVHGDLWHVTPSQVAAEILKVVFCPKGVCRPAAADRWLLTAPVLAEVPASEG